MPNWQVRAIAPDDDFDGAPLLRGQFVLDHGHGAVVAARLHLTALGVVEAWLNGKPVGTDLLAPGWSSYEWRLRYRTHDVTALVTGTSEPLVLGVALGNGWYRGRLTWNNLSNVYGRELAAFAQLEVDFADGHQQVVGTDETWTSGPSATAANDIYDGQTIDARRVSADWLHPDFTSPQWSGVHPVSLDTASLAPQISPPVRRLLEIAPQRVWTSPSGKTLLDFGQNLVGWIRLTVTGTAGHAVRVSHAEVLEHDELGIRPLRTADAVDTYQLSGGVDTFEPTFTFHGFRYAQIEGWPEAELDPESVTAVVVGSDLRRIGTFACSDPDLNQLHSNIVWSQRGNFLSIPTDCPQRDERLGWTGDIAVFTPSAAYLFDSGAFLGDWLVDLAAEQAHNDDIVPFVVPDVLKYAEDHPSDLPPHDTTAIWSDAAVWVPWALYQAYGDTQVLSDQFASIMSHTRRVARLLSPSDLWDETIQFGDWLDPDAPPDRPADAKADPNVVATACAYRTADLTARIAQVLGRQDEATEARAMATAIRRAFNEHYVTAGRVLSDCPTVYALAIHFGLLDPPDLEAAGARLAELVAKADYKVSTGFAGTPYITDALTSTGHVHDAYRLLLERECPSWLYSVGMGATTIWERWDSMLPDGSINPGQMTSFNHYALGAVADWMHRTIGGVAPDAPGYSRIRVAPRPGGGLTWAEAGLDTPHGHVATRWDLQPDGTLTLALTVPPGAIAVVDLDGVPVQELTEGRHVVTAPAVTTAGEPA